MSCMVQILAYIKLHNGHRGLVQRVLAIGRPNDSLSTEV